MAKRTPRAKSRLGWSDYYAAEFNKTGRTQAAHMACWYLLLHLAFGD